MNEVGLYPYRKHLLAAAAAGLAGQLTALYFMFDAGPYSTLLFIGPGMGLILLGILVFSWVLYLEARARADSVSDKTFEAGETIFRQGDPGEAVFVIKEGEVEVLREDPQGEEQLLATLGPGEYFGEMALLSAAPRNATVRASSRVTVLSIDRHDFQNLFAGIPAFRQSVDRVVAQRSAPAADRSQS